MTTNDDIPTAIWSATFRLCGVDLRVHVLSDGKRIIDKDSLDALFSAWENGATPTPEEAAAFAQWYAYVRP